MLFTETGAEERRVFSDWMLRGAISFQAGEGRCTQVVC